MTTDRLSVDALGLVEATILAALNAQPPRGKAAWDLHRPDTVAALTLPATGATRILRLYTAQHQTADTAQFVGARWYRGRILVKSLAATADAARAGLSSIQAAMAALSTYTPAGSRVRARFVRPQPLPAEVIHVRGLLYDVDALAAEGD